MKSWFCSNMISFVHSSCCRYSGLHFHPAVTFSYVGGAISYRSENVFIPYLQF